ncbi:MAG: tRNA (adenosine(37)-N6)-threonylcarbamoyltransferase complex dimerization subunit type 1 TsaB [Bacilli bacterium]
MKTMILDTSTKMLYIAFVDDTKVIYEIKQAGKNNHSEHFLKAIEEGLKMLNLQVKDFDKIIVGIGPGSYTGLRISLTVAKIWSWTLNIPLYTVSSLDLLGSGYFNRNGIFAILSVAKSLHVYGKVIEIKDGKVTTIVKESFMEKEVFLNSISHLNYSIVDEENYAVNLQGLQPSSVTDLHALAPNYMRREL